MSANMRINASVDCSPHLSFAIQLAEMAAKDILARMYSPEVHEKDDGSYVTDADKAAERSMRDMIADAYPGYSILGEEGGELCGTNEYQWVLDPIDGTATYVLGLPVFGTLISLLRYREPILGVIHLPVTRETVFAERGAGCWYSTLGVPPRRVTVDDSVSSLKRAHISIPGTANSRLDMPKSVCAERLLAVPELADRTEYIGNCVQHMLVVLGRIHLALDWSMQPWDSAAIVPCIAEAGGAVCTIDGHMEDVTFGGSLITSSSQLLNEEVVMLLRGRDK